MRRLIHRIFPIAFTLVLLALLTWGWMYLRRPTTLPFHQVRLVYPALRIDAQQIKQLAWQNIQGGFFSLDADKLKSALLHQPWVASVSIRREWPDTIALSIDEKRPEARWGSTGVITASGEVFYPPVASIPANLPMINAPVTQKKEILTNFQKLSDDVQQLQLQIKTLTVTDRGMYQVVLSNGLPVMIGRDDLEARFHRFVHLYPRLVGVLADQVANVDLRYSNGFAVKWKTKHLRQKQKKSL